MGNIYEKIMRRIKNRFSQYLILHNIYNTHYRKKCIILYIVNPFFNSVKTHTNQQIAIVIAQILRNKGYNIDVVQYNTKRKLDLKKYDLVFGFGEQFDRFLVENEEYIREAKIITIGLLTGASPYYSNIAELSRLYYFKERNGEKLKLQRQVQSKDGLMNLQALQNLLTAICTGNDWTVQTWGKMIDKVYKITATGFETVKLQDINRDISKAKKNFLWFSGAGMLHKGLDLCIEAFRINPELHLYIAGVMDLDFKKFYKKDFENDNIHYCGFVDTGSNEYKQLCEKCLFSILPSCSEGVATSVLTTMFSGMIPVVTKEAGVDILEWGVEIEKASVEYIAELIKKLSLMPDGVLKCRETKAYRYAMENHTIEKFSNDFSKIVDTIIEEY